MFLCSKEFSLKVKQNLWKFVWNGSTHILSIKIRSDSIQEVEEFNCLSSIIIKDGGSKNI